MHIPVTPIRDRIFFTFAEELSNISFMPKTQYGIILTDVYDFTEVRAPKWGQIRVCGPEVSDDIKKSTYILIEPGKWTTRILYDDKVFWSTEESFIMATTDDETATYRY